MGQITATRNLVATKVVRHAGQWDVPNIIDCGLVAHIFISHHWYRYWLVACSVPSHYWWFDNGTPRNKLKYFWIFCKEKSFRKNAFENVAHRPFHSSLSILHYNGFACASWCLKSSATGLFVQQLAQQKTMEISNFPISGLLWGGYADARQIPITNDR